MYNSAHCEKVRFASLYILWTCPIANASNISITPEFAANVWQNLSHLNLSGTHKHNFRQGKGIVDDWKNSLTNHHLQIMRDYGFDELFDALGYDVLSDLDEKQYTPFQEKINKLINHNEVYNNYPDQDLFTFAFNKSNLISDKYDFKRYDWKQSTQIERSCFKDEAMSLAIWDIAEASANQVNEVLSDCLSQQFLTVEQAEKNIDTLYQKYKDQGLDIIGFPSNDFRQEYQSEEKTASVCFKNFGVSFTMLSHSSIKGQDKNAFFQTLVDRTGTEPNWNFNKYLVSSIFHLIRA